LAREFKPNNLRLLAKSNNAYKVIQECTACWFGHYWVGTMNTAVLAAYWA
jgi:hypothetical protein